MISLFSKKKIVGIDIGSTSIKMAELDVGRKTSSLLAFGIIPTPADAFAGGDITNPNAIGEAIRGLADKIKTKRKHAATGLGGTSVIVKRITIPRMDEKLISEQIRWEAEQYIPYDINEVNLDYQILKRSGSTSESMDLLLIAAVQAHVLKYAETLAVAGFECSVLDVSGFALLNCFRSNYGEMQGQTVALLNLGSTATTMVVMEGGEGVFCRDIPVGGLNYTLDLQKGLNISFEEAEALKLNLSTGQAVPEEAAAIVKTTHEVVSDEIKASFDFFMNTSRSQAISRTFVTGGGAKVDGLIQHLSELSPCEKLDPFYNIKINSKDFSASYLNKIRDFSAVAVGLGLREVGDE